MLMLSWSMAVKPEPTTLAVLFWLEAPAPVAACWVVVTFPKLCPPTLPPELLTTVAFEWPPAKAPSSAEAVPANSTAARGRAATAARTRTVRMLAMVFPPRGQTLSVRRAVGRPPAVFVRRRREEDCPWQAPGTPPHDPIRSHA